MPSQDECKYPAHRGIKAKGKRANPDDTENPFDKTSGKRAKQGGKDNSSEESKDRHTPMSLAGESAMSLGVPQISANIYTLSPSQNEVLEEFPDIWAEVERFYKASTYIGRKAILENIQKLTQDVPSLAWLNIYANEELKKYVQPESLSFP